jgi:hypothetical protein
MRPFPVPLRNVLPCPPPPGAGRNLRTPAREPGLPRRSVAPRPAVALLDDPPLCCALCHAPVTSESRRISVAGDHCHVLANPYGMVFEIGCFAAAPGCTGSGPLTTDFSWFAGTAWQTALCARCRQHLGWRYTVATGGHFYGLILNRLVSGPGAHEA